MFAKMFPGGVHPHVREDGKIVNSSKETVKLTPPQRIVIALSQHIGAPATALVKKGDHVLMGQKIGEAGGYVSAPVHASVSGVVADVKEIIRATGAPSLAIMIDNDGKDEAVEFKPAANPYALTADELIAIVREAGIVGMGGAAFPTAVKMKPGPGKKFDTLVINGSECEPFLTVDDRLMQENPTSIVDGIAITMKALDIPKAIIVIEDNKPAAIESMKNAAKEGISVLSVPVCYPEGGEKQLIYAATKRAVPCGGLPADVGVLVCNVATMAAVRDAVIEGKPVMERLVCVSGLVNNPGNFLVRIGTTVDDILCAAGGMKDGARKLISGGPMMGTALYRTDCPLTKGMSALTVLGEEGIAPAESACIRCGRCVRACPMTLMPSKIDTLTRLDRIDAAEKAGAMNCIECGACTYVCPAGRRLTDSCRKAKNLIVKNRNAAKAKAAAEAKKEG